MAVLRWHVLVHGIMKCRLLDLARWATAHGEPAPRENPFVSLEGHKFLGFLAEGNRPESMHGIQFEKESLAVKLLNLICGQWERARHWFQAVVD